MGFKFGNVVNILFLSKFGFQVDFVPGNSLSISADNEVYFFKVVSIYDLSTVAGRKGIKKSTKVES